MDERQAVYDILKKLEIPYDVVEHPPALTTEDFDNFIEGKEGVRTKSLFLCNRKKTSYYLLIMDEHKRLDMKKLGELIGEKLKFASEEKLAEKLGLTPGIVSLFGLIHNEGHDIKIYIDLEMLEENIITFTANTNTATVFVTKENMFRFIEAMEYEYEIVDL